MAAGAEAKAAEHLDDAVRHLLRAQVALVQARPTFRPESLLGRVVSGGSSTITRLIREIEQARRRESAR